MAKWVAASAEISSKELYHNVNNNLVKVHFRGPELYKKRDGGALFQEESDLSRIYWSSSLNLHNFHPNNIVFWWQDRQDYHVLVVHVVIMTSQCRCTRALSQSHVVKRDNHVPVTPLKGSGTGCHVDAMAAVWQNHIGKNIKITFKLRPSIHNRFVNLFMKAQRYQAGIILLEIVPPFLIKLCSSKLHFYQ